MTGLHIVQVIPAVWMWNIFYTSDVLNVQQTSDLLSLTDTSLALFFNIT